MSTTSAAVPSRLAPPHGIDQIVATFGNIFRYIHDDHTLDATWEKEFLGNMNLPFPLALSWDKSRTITRIRCHKIVAPILAEVFAKIQIAGLQNKLITFGGCFSFRQQRTGAKLSAHSWGIAIDLNPETNTQGSVGDMDPEVVSIFRDAGFEWGGDWQSRSRDPMHFQFCTGY